MKTRVPPDVLIPVSEVDTDELDRMFRFVARHGANPQGVNAWLLYLGSQNLQLTTTLLEEMRRMTSDNDQLNQSIQDLLNAFTDNTDALDAEVTAARNAGIDGAHPAISAAVTNIENIVAKMKQSTTAARAAFAPAVAASASSGSSGTDAAASSGSTAGSSPATAASTGS